MKHCNRFTPFTQFPSFQLIPTVGKAALCRSATRQNPLEVRNRSKSYFSSKSRCYFAVAGDRFGVKWLTREAPLLPWRWILKFPCCTVLVQDLRPKGQDVLKEELGTMVDKEMVATSTAIEEAVLRMDVRENASSSQ